MTLLLAPYLDTSYDRNYVFKTDDKQSHFAFYYIATSKETLSIPVRSKRKPNFPTGLTAVPLTNEGLEMYWFPKLFRQQVKDGIQEDPIAYISEEIFAPYFNSVRKVI